MARRQRGDPISPRLFVVVVRMLFAARNAIVTVARAAGLSSTVTRPVSADETMLACIGKVRSTANSSAYRAGSRLLHVRARRENLQTLFREHIRQRRDRGRVLRERFRIDLVERVGGRVVEVEVVTRIGHEAEAGHAGIGQRRRVGAGVLGAVETSSARCGSARAARAAIALERLAFERGDEADRRRGAGVGLDRGDVLRCSSSRFAAFSKYLRPPRSPFSSFMNSTPRMVRFGLDAELLQHAHASP